ncbi:PIN domain-containing protein [Botrimarina sp.]|uniref:type II toxin-antitoxin system VapC family toxin n=1 Tax=Botrimarina sp. TaxID=2795802 RepID=UPI0032EB1998
MSLLFVDTGVWYAASLPEDRDHALCRTALASATARLLTTDYVLDELLTLLSARGHRDVAVSVGQRLLEEDTVTLLRITDADIAEAWRVFKSFTDKRWSFTDCTSYAVMQRLAIGEALALDDHFRQFGFLKVRP